jgi:hypothetical protein
MRTFAVAPSDFAWLLDQCPRCFWLKSRGLIKPKDNLPRIFNHIDGCMKRVYDIAALQSLGIPAKGLIDKAYVKSAPIAFEEHGVSLVIGGYLDQGVLLEDDTIGIYDFKSTDPNHDRILMYGRQLHSYLTGIENPASGEGREVTDLGLIVFNAYEGTMTRDNKGNVAQRGKEEVITIEVNRAQFQNTLSQVAMLLGSEDMPAPGDLCATCLHVAAVRKYEKDREAMKARKAEVA